MWFILIGLHLIYYTIVEAIVFKPAVHSTGLKSQLKSRTTSINQHLPGHVNTCLLVTSSAPVQSLSITRLWRPSPPPWLRVATPALYFPRSCWLNEVTTNPAQGSFGVALPGPSCLPGDGAFHFLLICCGHLVFRMDAHHPSDIARRK